MARITGRPSKAIRQERHIGFVVTRAQYEVIEKKVKETGVNISDYMRQVAVFATVVPRWRKQERRLFKELVGMSNEMHQCLQIARQEGALHAMLHFERFRARMDKVMEKLEKEPREKIGQDGDRGSGKDGGPGAGSEVRKMGKDGGRRMGYDGTKAGKVKDRGTDVDRGNAGDQGRGAVSNEREDDKEDEAARSVTDERKGDRGAEAPRSGSDGTKADKEGQRHDQ